MQTINGIPVQMSTGALGEEQLSVSNTWTGNNTFHKRIIINNSTSEEDLAITINLTVPSGDTTDDFMGVSFNFNHTGPEDVDEIDIMYGFIHLHDGCGYIANTYGYTFRMDNDGCNVAGEVIGFHSAINLSNAANIATAYQIRLDPPSCSGSSTWTNNYAIKIGNQVNSHITNSYAVWSDGGRWVIHSGGDTVSSMTIFGTGGQTANIQEWRTEDGGAGILDAAVSHHGYFVTAKNAAPNDSEVDTNQAAYWFDPTPGSAKFMIKAKDSNGAVVTAAISLT